MYTLRAEAFNPNGKVVYSNAPVFKVILTSSFDGIFQQISSIEDIISKVSGDSSFEFTKYIQSIYKDML